MGNYKGIEFAKDYNKSFADFKNEFASTHIFKRLLPKVKEAELKKAYKIATQWKKNGIVSRGTGKSQEAKPPKGKDRSI